MSYEKVKQASHKRIGTKQTLKAIKNGELVDVVVANDADSVVIEPILQMARDHQITVYTVDSMLRLGKVCGIDVGATAVAVKKVE
ncbi:50S ribosomal protein L7ae-like protein [Bacillaceae bacterium SIJ1]|uniref:50S ribosomal protein L7ae-like protein n=1 Tax=Litoribacterium kuwaitense TaxID=1398745 RepID=UPI0013EB15E5|nr:50S ribosomal protein L7ae-like protein [Litoribacterium kuwaitense]NGP45835.1 50S ribosomal protein L7ae-like protein [Litoribacterium kuwaitense]